MGPEQFGVVEKPLTLVEQIYNQAWLRKIAIIVLLARDLGDLRRWLDNPLLVPTFSATISRVVARYRRAERFPSARLSSIAGLADRLHHRHAAGRAADGVRHHHADRHRFLETMTAMFNPLPAIALLPLALIWFGLGTGSLVFVLVHSVMWAVALNTHGRVPRRVEDDAHGGTQLRSVRGLRFVAKILIPAAFPSILAGLKIGWAFAWRTLIAAELVFGVVVRVRAGLAGTSSRARISSISRKSSPGCSPSS